MRARTLTFTVAVLLLLLPTMAQSAHSSAGNTPILSVTPPRIQPSGNSFSANVTLYIPPTVSVGAYDIVLTAIPLPDSSCIPNCPLSITGIQPGNIFPAGQYIEVANCVNGSGMGCGANDGGGAAHSAEAYGQSVSGGAAGLNVTVFTVKFGVTGTGSVSLKLQNDTLVNGNNAAQNLPHTTEDALFSNNGLAAFFNILTAIPVVGRAVGFDASDTFSSSNTTLSYRSSLNYSWNFGDGQKRHGLDLNMTSNTYTSIGTYDVTLSVTDEYGATSSYQTRVNVHSALGTINLSIVDQTGARVHTSVAITLYNGTSTASLVGAESVNPSLNAVVLTGLSEGTYFITFLGPGVTASSITETVIAGWTTADSVSLTVQYPTPPSRTDLSGIQLAVVTGVVGAGAVLGIFALIRRRGSKPKKPRKK